MTWDLTLQAFQKIAPMVITLIVWTALEGITVFLTWLITRKSYWGKLEKEVNRVSKGLETRYQEKIIEIDKLKEQLQQERLAKKEIRALLSKALEKINL